MSGGDLERVVHDYIDGRMSERERASFEARVAKDPELSARIEFHRGVGRALRSPIEGPRPGYAARARARFEAEGRRATGWRRLLRWEAAGLVAAGVLLAALILPTRWEGIPLSHPTQSERAASEPQVEDQPARAPAAAAARAPALAPAELPAKKEAARQAQGTADATADAREERSDGGRDESGAGAALSAAPVPESAEPVNRMKAVADMGFVARSAPVPVGAIPDGSVERYQPAEADASKSISGFAKDALSELPPLREREELILVGARARPISCERYRVEVSSQALRIFFSPPGPGRPASPGGCVVVVPLCTLPVVVEEPRDGE